MGIRTTIAASVLAISTLVSAVTAQAAVLYSAPGNVTQQVLNTTYSINFNALSGPGDLSFVLDGYRSLDGQNWYEDDFTLSLNSVAILKGTFNLGGGGNDVVFFAPVGSTINNVSGNGTNITWSGGHVNITTPLGLNSGQNTLTFAYDALGGNHAGFQPWDDEHWGVSDILVTQTGAVPEPATWAMMIIGFAAVGGTLRQTRRRLVLARI